MDGSRTHRGRLVIPPSVLKTEAPTGTQPLPYIVGLPFRTTSCCGLSSLLRDAFSTTQRKAEGGFDFTRPYPGFSVPDLEKRILDLQKLGVEADLILWHPYDRWGFARIGARARRPLPALLPWRRLAAVSQKQPVGGPLKERRAGSL